MARFEEITTSVEKSYLNESWDSYSGLFVQPHITAVKFQTGTTNPFYLSYRTYNKGRGWLPYVSSLENDYAGYGAGDTRHVQSIGIQVYDSSTGTKLDQNYIVMYRAYMGGRWLSWVSNAKPELMYEVYQEFKLGGELDTASGNAGLPGSEDVLERFQIRIFKDNNLTDTDVFTGGEVGATMSYLVDSNWNTFNKQATDSHIDGIKIQTSTNKDYYLQYKTWNEGKTGYYAAVKSTEDDYAGSPGKPIQRINIQVYKNDGTKLSSGVVVMYRACVEGEWLPWVSNADPEWMRSVQTKYSLGGTLDTASSYAGAGGKNIEGIEIRIFEDDSTDAGSGSFTGNEVSLSMRYMANSASNWTAFNGQVLASPIDGLEIKTSGTDYYLLYKTWNEGKTGYYPAVKSTEDDYAGSAGKPIQRLNIQVCKNDGTKLTTGVVVMYRAYVEGKWLPWVSNADPEWMSSVQVQYNLGGTLDVNSSYAGISGKNIEGIEVRAFEGSTLALPEEDLAGEEAAATLSYLKDGNWTAFDKSVLTTNIDGIKIQTAPTKPYYLLYKTHNEGKTGFYSAVKSTEDDYAGSSGRPIQKLSIQVYKNDGTKLTTGVVVMYRAYVDGAWLPWVSNADPEWMQAAQVKYALGGRLDTASYYAGIGGKNIEGVEIRIFEENSSVITPTGNYKIIDVPFITQNGDYPTGCESVTTVMALRHAGYNISVNEFIDNYLDKQSYPFDPNETFGGSPYSTSGYGCYAPVIKKALDKFLPDAGYRAINIYKPTLEELCTEYIDHDIPVVLWATMDMKTPYLRKTWTYNGKTINWISPEHCLLLVGYDDNHYIFNDPLKWSAPTFYSKEAVEVAYNGLLKQAIAIEKSTQTLPDVSDAYRRYRAENFMSTFGIGLKADFSYGVQVPYDLGYFAVCYKIHKNTTVETDSSFKWATYDIVNGTLSTTLDMGIEDVYNQLGAEITADIGFNNAYLSVDFVKQISNGTVKYGVKLNSDGELVVHIIAKEILRMSGPVIYSQTYELEIVFRSSDNSSPEAEPAFSLKEYFESLNFEEGVKVVGIGVLTIGVVVALVYCFGGFAGIAAAAKSFIASQGAQSVLIGYSLLNL